MGSAGLNRARDKMVAAGVDEVAIETFAHYYRLLEHGETGMIPESSIEPLDMESLADVEVSDEDAAAAIRTTAVIKLNGGLGTSMGMDRAKSLLCVRRGLSFLDIIARQVLHLRKRVRRPAAADLHEQLPHVRPTPWPRSRATRTSPVDGLPLEFLQNKEPKLLVKDLSPVSYPKDPDLEWCPPGHGDLYTALRGTGLLDRLIDAGYRNASSSPTPTTSARCPTPGSPAGSPTSGAPFAIEAVRRTPSDRKGGHFARRKTDGRIVLRESGADPRQGQGGARRPRPPPVHARPTTCGSTCAAMQQASSTVAAASSACR